MRSICRVLAVVAILGLATGATAAEPCCGNYGMWAGYGAYEGYCAPACGAPCYGLVPGCCEFPPSCCDHVWAGYCQELRGLDAVRALFPNRCCRGCGRGVGAGCCGPACEAMGTGCCASDPAPGVAPAAPPAEASVEIPLAPKRAG